MKWNISENGALISILPRGKFVIICESPPRYGTVAKRNFASNKVHYLYRAIPTLVREASPDVVRIVGTNLDISKIGELR